MTLEQLPNNLPPAIGNTRIPHFADVAKNIPGASWASVDLNGMGVPELIAGTSSGEIKELAPQLAVLIKAGSTTAAVTVTAVNDLIANPGETIGVKLLESPNYFLTVNHSGVQHDVVDTYDANENGKKDDVLPGIYYRDIAIQDNDVAGIVTQATDTTITEDGKTVPLSVKLTSQPVSPVTVYVGSSDPTAGLITVAGKSSATGTLTFTSANWNVLQTVNVTPVNDQIAYGTRQFNVLFSSSSDDVPYRQLKAPSIQYTTLDNDKASVVVTGPESTVPGYSNVIGVKLSTQPIGEVRVTLTPDNNQVRIATSQAGASYTIVFNSTTWSQQQQVPIFAADNGLVQYTHKSQIQFSVDTGRSLDGTPAAVISTLAQAYDLGDVSNGLTWTNFPNDFASNTSDQPRWLKFHLSNSVSESVSIFPPVFTVTPDYKQNLYDSKGNLLATATPEYGATNPANDWKLSLQGLVPGDYYLRLTRTAKVVFDSPDQSFQKVNLAPIDFSIADNDVPTATVIPGPSATELNSTPSYFAVKLNAPANAAAGSTGIRVNFQITGGQAIVGDVNSKSHDYSVVADFFDASTGKGYVRVAPGDVQANIGILPVDNKLVSVSPKDVQLTILPGDGYILPLAPDKQSLNPRDSTVQADIKNFDPSHITSSLLIIDDDLPGIQVIRAGDDTNLSEGNTATYNVSLASEPGQDVTVTLTPDGQIAFDNPAAPVQQAKVSSPTYILQALPASLSNLDLRLDSLVQTNLGWTAALDGRLKASANDGKNITLLGSDSTNTTGNGSDQVTFEIPAAAATDAAGSPVAGNWNQYHHLVLSGLTLKSSNGQDYFELKLTLNGVASVVKINVDRSASKTVNTTQLTFKRAEWYKPQQVVVRALPNSVAEPGNWHQALISAKFTAGEPVWTGTKLPDTVVHLADQQLQAGQTAQALDTGFGVLEDSLNGVKLPLVGNLLDAAPELGNFFTSALTPLDTALKSQGDLSVTELDKISEGAIVTTSESPGGFLDKFEVTPEATADEVTLHLTMEKTWHLFDLNLSSDLGLDALGLSLKTEGSLTADVEFKMDFVIGISRTFGFFIDTAQTGLDVDASVKMDGFKGTGGLGFLKLDFNDDPNNPSALSLHFHAGLNDLDNSQTIKFLDVNGDGLLGNPDPNATSPNFTTGIGHDNLPVNANGTKGDGLLDLNADGQPDLVATLVTEPFQNVNAQGVPVDQAGKASNFPTVSSLSTLAPLAKNINWNGNDTFDPAVSVTKEGVYRTRTQNGKTIIYFDANNNGKLDIGKRNVDPFNSKWADLPSANKDSSEIWIAAGTPIWTTGQTVLAKPFVITSVRNPGIATKYYFDANGNGVQDQNEQISDKLRKNLDKNNNGILDPNVQTDGEGVFVQGTGIAFVDSNNNGLLDYGEKFVNSNFGDTAFPDVGDAGYAGKNAPYVVSQSTQPNGNIVDYIDLNGNGFDAYDPQAPHGEPVTVPEMVNGKALFITLAITNANGKQTMTVNGVDGIDINQNIPALGKSWAELFHITAGQTSFTYFDADGDGKLTAKDFAVRTSEGKRYIDLDYSGTLTVSNDGQIQEPFAVQNNEFDLSKLKNADGSFSGPVVKLLNDGDRLTLQELLNFTKQIRTQNSTTSTQAKAEQTLFAYTFEGQANLGLQAVTSVNGNEAFPSFKFDLAVNFPLFNFSNEGEAGKTGFTVNFNNVKMELGTFLKDFAAPIIKTVDEVLGPIKPIVKTLNADTKIFDALGLGDFIGDTDKQPGVSLLEIARKLAEIKKDQKQIDAIDAAIKFATTLSKIIDLVDTLNGTLSSGDSTEIDFGSFSLNDLRAASDDIANSASHARKATPANGQHATAVTMTADATGTPPANPGTTLTRDSGAAAAAAMVASTKKKSNLFNKLSQLDGFTFDLFNADTVMSLLMGEPAVNIITYNVPSINFDFDITKTFPIFGPLSGLLNGKFHVGTDISVGFDTAGIDEWKNDGFDPGKAYEVFDGFYVNDWNASGVDKNELQLTASIAVGAGLDLGIISGYVLGGIRANLGLDLVDTGERNGTSDGKVRGSDIINAFSHNPLDLFQLNGSIDAFLGVLVEVDFVFFSEVVYDKELATFRLAEFKIDSHGASGSSDFGKAQAGPISGGFVWLDANNNNEYDNGEPSTITDAVGNYDLVIPDGYDTGSGIVRIRGGIDITTGMPSVLTMSDHLGESVATPFTSLAEQVAATPVDPALIDFVPDGTIDTSDIDKFYELYGQKDLSVDLNKDGVVDQRDVNLFELYFDISQNGGTPTSKQAGQLILNAAGLDPNLDVSRFAQLDASLANDPGAAKALVQVDSYEGLVAGVKAFLVGAAGDTNDDPVTEGIFTDAIYKAVAQRIVTGQTDLTDLATVLKILQDAISFANDGLASHGLSLRIDPAVASQRAPAVAQVLVADSLDMLTLANQANSTLELASLVTKVKLSDEKGRTDDLNAFGKGTMTEQQLLSVDARFNDAELARIRALTLPPEILPISDFHIPENGSVSGAHFQAFDLDTPTAALKMSVTSDNPGLIPADNVSVTPQSRYGDWTLDFAPLANASGEARITLTLTDESGNHTSRTFNVIVNHVNQAPGASDDVINTNGILGVTFDPRSNDTDIENDPLSITVLSFPQHGQLIENGNDTFTYVANPGYAGVDTASYAVSDGNGGVSTATMTFNVAGDLTAQFVNPVADTRNTTLNSVDVTFSRPIDGKTLSTADFQLTRNRQIVPLTRAQTVTFVSGTTYRIGNLAALTRQQGNYELFINTRGISDTTGHPGTTTVSEYWLMDTVAPSSRVNSLPAYTNSLTLQVSWGGTDSAGGSGLVKYDIYVSDNGKPYTRWLTDTVETSHTFDVEDGHTYRFISVATDLAGNSELFKPGSAVKTLIDITPPTSSVRPLPSIIRSTSFVISWGGNDGAAGSGIATYDIYVSDNNGSFQAIAVGTTKTSTRFTGVAGHQYEFYSVATDLAGNRQLTPLKANAKTTIRR